MKEEEITGKATTALWGYAFLPSKALLILSGVIEAIFEFLCVTREIGKILVVVYPALIHSFLLQDKNLKIA